MSALAQPPYIAITYFLCHQVLADQNHSCPSQTQSLRMSMQMYEYPHMISEQ